MKYRTVSAGQDGPVLRYCRKQLTAEPICDIIIAIARKVTAVKYLKDPRLQIALSMTIFGTIGLFVRNIPVSSGELALYRAVLACVVIGVFLLLTRQKISLAGMGKELILLFISGAAMGVNWILLFEAYKYTTVSVATLSYYFAPVIVTLVCPVLFREKLTGKQIICFVMSTIGLALITGVGDLGQGSSHFTGILFGLGAAVFYASVVLLNKFIKCVGGIQRSFLQFAAAIVTLIPYVILTDGVHIDVLDGGGWTLLLAVGVIHTGVTYCMYFSSLRSLPGQEAAILSYIDPLVAVIISVTVLKETMNIWQIIGGALILAFTLYNELPSKKR